jgi:hypothetical protein
MCAHCFLPRHHSTDKTAACNGTEKLPYERLEEMDNAVVEVEALGETSL